MTLINDKSGSTKFLISNPYATHTLQGIEACHSLDSISHVYSWEADTAIETYAKHKLFMQRDSTHGGSIEYGQLAHEVVTQRTIEEKNDNKQSHNTKTSSPQHHIRVGASYQAIVPKLMEYQHMCHHQSRRDSICRKDDGILKQRHQSVSINQTRISTYNNNTGSVMPSNINNNNDNNNTNNNTNNNRYSNVNEHNTHIHDKYLSLQFNSSLLESCSSKSTFATETCYDATPNCSKTRILWDSRCMNGGDKFKVKNLSEENLIKYLQCVQLMFTNHNNDGICHFDEAKALYFLQEMNYDVCKALNLLNLNPSLDNNACNNYNLFYRNIEEKKENACKLFINKKIDLLNNHFQLKRKSKYKHLIKENFKLKQKQHNINNYLKYNNVKNYSKLLKYLQSSYSHSDTRGSSNMTPSQLVDGQQGQDKQEQQSRQRAQRNEENTFDTGITRLSSTSKSASKMNAKNGKAEIETDDDSNNENESEHDNINTNNAINSNDATGIKQDIVINEIEEKGYEIEKEYKNQEMKMKNIQLCNIPKSCVGLNCVTQLQTPPSLWQSKFQRYNDNTNLIESDFWLTQNMNGNVNGECKAGTESMDSENKNKDSNNRFNISRMYFSTDEDVNDNVYDDDNNDVWYTSDDEINENEIIGTKYDVISVKDIVFDNDGCDNNDIDEHGDLEDIELLLFDKNQIHHTQYADNSNGNSNSDYDTSQSKKHKRKSKNSQKTRHRKQCKKKGKSKQMKKSSEHQEEENVYQLCFIDWQEMPDIICDMKFCQLAYHYHCLNVDANKIKNKLNSRNIKDCKQCKNGVSKIKTDLADFKFYCPKHTCVVCIQQAIQSVKESESASASNDDLSLLPLCRSTFDQDKPKYETNPKYICSYCINGYCNLHVPNQCITKNVDWKIEFLCQSCLDNGTNRLAFLDDIDDVASNTNNDNDNNNNINGKCIQLPPKIKNNDDDYYMDNSNNNDNNSSNCVKYRNGNHERFHDRLKYFTKWYAGWDQKQTLLKKDDMKKKYKFEIDWYDLYKEVILKGGLINGISSIYDWMDIVQKYNYIHPHDKSGGNNIRYNRVVCQTLQQDYIKNLYPYERFFHYTTSQIKDKVCKKGNGQNITQRMVNKHKQDCKKGRGNDNKNKSKNKASSNQLTMDLLQLDPLKHFRLQYLKY